MKILVNKIPKEPKECLFAVPSIDSIKRNDIICVPKCNIDDRICNLYKNNNCNKLRSINNGF